MKYKSKSVIVDAMKVKDILSTIKSKWSDLPKWFINGYEIGRFIIRHKSIEILYDGGKFSYATFDDWIISCPDNVFYSLTQENFEKYYDSYIENDYDKEIEKLKDNKSIDPLIDGNWKNKNKYDEYDETLKELDKQSLNLILKFAKLDDYKIIIH